jgi:hypothetical protein
LAELWRGQEVHHISIVWRLTYLYWFSFGQPSSRRSSLTLGSLGAWIWHAIPNEFQTKACQSRDHRQENKTINQEKDVLLHYCLFALHVSHRSRELLESEQHDFLWEVVNGCMISFWFHLFIIFWLHFAIRFLITFWLHFLWLHFLWLVLDFLSCRSCISLQTTPLQATPLKKSQGVSWMMVHQPYIFMRH